MSMILLLACLKTEKPIASRTELISSNWKMQPEEKLQGIEEKSISQNEFIWFDMLRSASFTDRQISIIKITDCSTK